MLEEGQKVSGIVRGGQKSFDMQKLKFSTPHQSFYERSLRYSIIFSFYFFKFFARKKQNKTNKQNKTKNKNKKQKQNKTNNNVEQTNKQTNKKNLNLRSVQ